jgi:penicillin-binding protein 1A
VQAKRQAGSAFKPFVYAAALERGASPGTIIYNLDSPTATPQGAWVPEDEHSAGNSMTMRTALRTSSNRAAVQMINAIGVKTAVEYANKLELGDMPAVPSLALGAGDVTLEDMTMAFGAFANGGMVRDAVFIRKVVDAEGNTLFESEDKPRKAIEEATAYFMADMLTDVIDHGTAYGARREGFTLPAAGKTGTTNDYKDAWFVGFTPDLAVGVYIGYDQPVSMGHGETGGSLAAPVVRDFLMGALKDVPPVPFRAPPGMKLVRVNHKSGQPAGPGDKSAIMEAFKPGQEPAGSVVAEDGADGGEMAGDDYGAPPPAPPPPLGPAPGNDRALTSGTGGLY